MTKEEFLKRCETIYDKGHFKNRNLSNLMAQWLDFVLRFEHTLFATMSQGQGTYVWDFLSDERNRIGVNNPRTLANDTDGYALQEIAAILDHPCQKCAEDINAWHTRYGFCEHKDKEETVQINSRTIKSASSKGNLSETIIKEAIKLVSSLKKQKKRKF